MTEQFENKDTDSVEPEESEQMTWQEKTGLSLKTPMGLFGISLTTICFILTLGGLAGISPGS